MSMYSERGGQRQSVEFLIGLEELLRQGNYPGRVFHAPTITSTMNILGWLAEKNTAPKLWDVLVADEQTKSVTGKPATPSIGSSLDVSMTILVPASPNLRQAQFTLMAASAASVSVLRERLGEMYEDHLNIQMMPLFLKVVSSIKSAGAC